MQDAVREMERPIAEERVGGERGRIGDVMKFLPKSCLHKRLEREREREEGRGIESESEKIKETNDLEKLRERE